MIYTHSDVSSFGGDMLAAVIASAPAYGSFSDFYRTWRNNATKLYPLLEQVRRARVMVFYLEAQCRGDTFWAGEPPARARSAEAQRPQDLVYRFKPAPHLAAKRRIES